MAAWALPHRRASAGGRLAADSLAALPVHSIQLMRSWSDPLACHAWACALAGNIVGSLIAAYMLRFGWGWSFVVPGAFIAVSGAC